MEEAPPDVKRRRISAADGSPQEVRCLTDLPSGILAHAASFLAAPSRALFAVALDENSAASSNERSAAIVGNEWDTLDFGGIEKELAIKLKDEDIEKVLLCIHAVNKVKRLKLTNCVNITGAGLEPLRGSLIIEQIDLSLVAHHKSPDLEPAPQISCDHVLPILDSIIASEGCLLRLNQMWESRGTISCLECNINLPSGSGRNEWIDTNTLSRGYGTQDHTCYDCFKHYCYDCKIDFCLTCQTDYCDDCKTMSDCQVCGDSHCNDCYEHECRQCHEKICLHCVEREYHCHKCGDCDRVFCSEYCYEHKCRECNVKICLDCVEREYHCYKCEDCHEVFCLECSNFEPGMSCCGQCNDRSCDDCRFRKFRQGEQDCTECEVRIAPLIVLYYS